MQRRALADFRDRKAAGLVPAPVDDPDGVARVDGPYFTPMRF